MDLLNKTRKPLSVAELHNELGFPVDRGELWDMVGYGPISRLCVHVYG